MLYVKKNLNFVPSYVHMHLFIVYAILGSLYTTCSPSIPGPPGRASLGFGRLHSRSSYQMFCCRLLLEFQRWDFRFSISDPFGLLEVRA